MDESAAILDERTPVRAAEEVRTPAELPEHEEEDEDEHRLSSASWSAAGEPAELPAGWAWLGGTGPQGQQCGARTATFRSLPGGPSACAWAFGKRRGSSAAA